jgi:hypothetical protein
MVMATTLSRDARGRVTSMSQSQPNFVFATYTSDFDSADRLMNSSRRTYLPSFVEEVASYSYDRGGQLTGVSRSIAPTVENYSYDAAGNRTGANGSTSTNTANNRLSSDGTYSYLYDDEGNTTQGCQSDDAIRYLEDYANHFYRTSYALEYPRLVVRRVVSQNVMWLLRRETHRARDLQSILHKGNVGGYGTHFKK